MTRRVYEVAKSISDIRSSQFRIQTALLLERAKKAAEAGQSREFLESEFPPMEPDSAVRVKRVRND